ncbi:hypothetical protein HZS_4581 [Henneguya salminicola]|nr:hypothetical protein HZS_4581 [Henneguya salminicola]
MMESCADSDDQIAEYNLFCKNLKLRIPENEKLESHPMFYPIFMHQIIEDENKTEENFVPLNLCFDPTFTASFIYNDSNEKKLDTLDAHILKYLPCMIRIKTKIIKVARNSSNI